MTFYLLILNELDTEKMRAINYLLQQHPNGTPLCCTQAIKTPKLIGALRVYWLDDEFVTPSRIEKICLLDGVKEFREISEVSVSINDPEWLWENDYIDLVFADVLSKYKL